MGKFNDKQANVGRTVSYEGGAVYEKDFTDELTNFMFSSLMQDAYYESAEEQQKRLVALLDRAYDMYGARFIAKLAHFSRNEIGLRSVSEFAAAYLNSKQFEGKRDFYKGYFRRPDGVAEVCGAIDALGDKRSHAFVRGAGDYISGLSAYQIDKYKMTGKVYNMFDLINLTHAHSAAIDDYKRGTLKPAGTWEQRISAAKSKEEKESSWRELVEDGRLGYLALLRNLRNICACSFATPGWLSEFVSPQLIDSVKIKRSLVFPYQIYFAYKAMEGSMPLPILTALNTAFTIAVGNMPELAGTSVVILDVSGSMNSPISPMSDMTIKEVGAVYAAAIYLGNPHVDFYKFGSEAKKRDYARNMMPFDLIKAMQDEEGCGYSTKIVKVFEKLDVHYDRMFVISDMQVMDISSAYHWEDRDVDVAYKRYRREFGDSRIYSYDLGNYSTQLTKPADDSIRYITALNDNVMKFIGLLEQGVSVVDYINDSYAI